MASSAPGPKSEEELARRALDSLKELDAQVGDIRTKDREEVAALQANRGTARC